MSQLSKVSATPGHGYTTFKQSYYMALSKGDLGTFQMRKLWPLDGGARKYFAMDCASERYLFIIYGDGGLEH